MEPWVQDAVGYIRSWIEFQMRTSQQPGCITAIAHRGKVIASSPSARLIWRPAKAHARHRFGSHRIPRVSPRPESRSSASSALRLDDPVGLYVRPASAGRATTIAQLLSHSAGLTRDGADAGQFGDRRLI